MEFFVILFTGNKHSYFYILESLESREASDMNSGTKSGPVSGWLQTNCFNQRQFSLLFLRSWPPRVVWFVCDKVGQGFPLLASHQDWVES